MVEHKPHTHHSDHVFHVERSHAKGWCVYVGSFDALNVKRGALVHGPTTKAKCVKWAQRAIRRNGGGSLVIGS